MENIDSIFMAESEKKKLVLQGPNLFQNSLKPVAKPSIENVKIICNEEMKEYCKNIITIYWVPENSKRYFIIQYRTMENVCETNHIWSFTKDLIELNGKILKLNCSIPIDNDNILNHNEQIIVTLTEDGLKKFKNMLKKWV